MRITSLIILVLALSFIGCTSTKTATQEPRYTPKFDYTPPERNNPSSAGVTIALINPQYTDDDPGNVAPPYSEFIDNMAEDFEEMLIAKGFSIRGPFKNRDEMVYSDKKNSDLALEINVSLKEEGQLAAKQYIGAGQLLGLDSQPTYKIAGTFYHYGNLILEVTDPFSGEKFWKKSVSLPKIPITCQGVEKWKQNPNPVELLSQDVGIYNPVAKALESYYKEAISTAWRHLDAEEFDLIKNEIAKARN